MAKIAKFLVVALLATCIVGALSSVPVSKASAVETESAYGGCPVKRCDNFEPCPDGSTPLPMVASCGLQTGDCEEQPEGTICGSVEQGSEYYARRCKTIIDYTPPFENRCYFREDQKRWFYTLTCRCEEATETCYQTEEVDYCGSQQYYYECYTDPQ